MGQLASIKEKILLENKIFTEELDGLKNERHQSATKQVHIQNTLSKKVIEQLEVKLRNQ
jgi:hypothetical protein